MKKVIFTVFGQIGGRFKTSKNNLSRPYILKKYVWCKFGQHGLSGLGTMAYGHIDIRSNIQDVSLLV